tara:strand:- start:35271 stop:35561 length:291 start_codon:yes stop_codon:yes gene_type:complete
MDTQAKCDCKTQFSLWGSGDNPVAAPISSRLFPFLTYLENVHASKGCRDLADDCTQPGTSETIPALWNRDNLLTHLIPVIPPPYYNINNLYKYLFI